MCIRDRGNTAAGWAMEYNYPMVFAFLDPEGAEKKGEELRQKMKTAKRVHVISTRYQKEESMMEQDKGKEYDDPTLSCDPFQAAQEAKKLLEQAGGGLVFVFDPNGDNAFLMGGNSKNANAIWLLNWLKALGRAKATGGRVIQIIVPGGPNNPSGLSKMQEAEALMASMWGVEVVKLDCREVKGYLAIEGDFEKMAGWAELKALKP